MSQVPIRLDAQVWEGVDAGTFALLDTWLVAPGDTVEAGQPLARVVLVKATLEVTAPARGRISAILVGAEQTFGRDAELGRLEVSP